MQIALLQQNKLISELVEIETNRSILELIEKELEGN